MSGGGAGKSVGVGRAHFDHRRPAAGPAGQAGAVSGHLGEGAHWLMMAKKMRY